MFAPAAAGALTRPAVWAATAGAFACFCMLASATYLLNDVRDRERDRRHPRKRHRPVAAGELSPPRATRIAAWLAIVGVCGAVLIAPALGAVAIGYLTLTTSYSIWWRHVVLADIAAVAAGFVLRAAAGGVASGVPLSRSFLAVSAACALFVVAGKRYAELIGDDQGRGIARATLARYSARLIGGVLVGAATVGCVAYAWWAFARPDPRLWFGLSIVPFMIWLGRYGVLLSRGAGEAPEEIILRDPLLLISGAAWLTLFLGGVYGAR